MSAIEGKGPPNNYPAAAEIPQKKKGFFNKIATLLHIRPKAPSSPEIAAPKQVTRVPSDSALSGTKESKEKERDVPGTIGPSRTANRLSIHLKFLSPKDPPPEVDRLLAYSSRQATPTYPLVEHSSSQKIREQLPAIYELLAKKTSENTQAKRLTHGALLIRDTSRSFQWISGRADDSSRMRKDAVESILTMVYIMLFDSYYTFSYVKKEKLDETSSSLKKEQKPEDLTPVTIQVFELTTMLFDNRGVRDLVHKDTHLNELWVKILFLQNYQRDQRLLSSRILLLKETAAYRETILQAAIAYQKQLKNELDPSTIEVINQRLIEIFDLNSVFVKTDTESVKIIAKSILNTPENVIGFTRSPPYQCIFSNYLNACQEAYVQFCLLYEEILKDPDKFAKKATTLYQEGAYLQCFKAFAKDAEENCSKYDEDFESILVQIAEKGLFILDRGNKIEKEERQALVAEIRAAKEKIELIAAVYKKIAEKLA